MNNLIRRDDTTVRIDGNQTFDSLGNFLQDLLKKWKLRLKKYKGSWSWWPPRPEQGGQSLWKLMFYGEGDIFVGIRREFIEMNGIAADVEKLVTHEFVVQPNTDNASFLGFPVVDDALSKENVRKILTLIPEKPRY